MKKLIAIALFSVVSLNAQQNSTTTTLRAARIIDGRGAVTNNGTVTIRDGKIVSIGQAGGTPTIDLGNLTLMPGFIDTHVHIGWHFDANDRYQSGPEPPE